MLDLNELHRPRSPEEAVRAFLDSEGTGLYVAGGTIVVPAASRSLDYLVDLTDSGLDYVRVEEERGLVIGATVRIADLILRPELSSPALAAVVEAASDLGTHTVRNRATVGGNLFAAHFPSDLPPVFLALDATITLQGEDAPRQASLADFYASRRDVYRRGDVLVDVAVPEPPEGTSSAFEKTGRTRVDVAIVNCAAALTVRDGTITRARLVLNGLSATPFVADEAARFLEGKPGSQELFEAAGEIVRSAVSPRDDHRASSSYRTRVSGVIAARALSRAAGTG
jgi:carbon-monoxide dehydrogenase medium subunit